MMRKLREARGFTLIEMSVIILLIGIIAAFSVPAYLNLNRSLQLKGAVSNLASQMQLARAKAMATGKPQAIHFAEAGFTSDYHVHNNGAALPEGEWKFPKYVTYVWGVGGGTLAGSPHQVTMTADGRASQSGTIVLQTLGGLRDTVNVQLSGLVTLQ
jgi:prepilin-type N-terminal cleavage/methylation domain-containing protein